MRSSPKTMKKEEQPNASPLPQREPLRRTKLFIPPVRPGRVTRPRLIEQLNRGLDKTLILISAPAAYGKTTLVSSWLGDSAVSSTWLSQKQGDAYDPHHFRYRYWHRCR
jgi:LuxR family maltose regulon positive regulatory protein